jgi:hypothetical protein
MSMKTFITILLIAVSSTFFGQEYNLKQGYLAEGYDVVSYFSNRAEKGDKEFTTIHNAVKFKFSSKKNLDTFKSAPNKYIHAYCLTQLAEKGKELL